jgi:hypothetical protein
MPGIVVTCTSLDSVRIEFLGGSRSLTIPASLILAVDKVLRYCLLHEETLDLDMVQDEPTGVEGWQACLDMGQTECGDVNDTPWAAIASLAARLQ